MFSNTIKITSLDDYITPSQNCVKPLLVGKENQAKISTDDILEVYKQVPEKPNLIKTKGNKTATVTLNDCLACSGCVTTAETILIQQQGTSELLKNLKNVGSYAIFSISPQSRTSLAYAFGVSESEIQQKMIDHMQKIGVMNVFDMGLAVDLAVWMSCEEITRGSGPVICSECPGWVCYAEKVVGETVIPLMSKIKSPQQIMGKLLKDFFSGVLGIEKNKIFHICVMPCYDKKLEALRPESNDYKDVDIVISTHEMKEFMEEMVSKKLKTLSLGLEKIESGEDLTRILENKEAGMKIQENFKKVQSIFSEIGDNIAKLESHPEQEKKVNNFEEIKNETTNEKPEKLNENAAKFPVNSVSDASSNSYLFYVMRSFIEKTLKKAPDAVEITVQKGKNIDFTKEFVISESAEKKHFFAKIYGLRNIQNFIRSFKKNNVSKYAYVEMMACPGGCLNGGGQIKHKDIKNKELLERLTEILHDKHSKKIVNSLQNGDFSKVEKFYSKDLLEVFATSFQAVEKYENLNW